MKAHDSATTSSSVAVPHGAVLALLGVVAFSFTLPSTALALEGFGPWTTAVLRASVAGLIAAGCLAAVRAPLPTRAQLPALAAVGAGCVVGFPLLTSLALGNTGAGDAAVVVGLLPVTTAVLATLLGGTRHSPAFWIAAGVGAAAVAGFTLARTGGSPGLGDLFLAGALLACAYGYAEGGRLAASMPGWRVIAWGLVLTLPLSLPATAAALVLEPAAPTPSAVAGLVYLSLVSQFGGFVPWYRGMGLIGVARAGQIQLVQPLLTLTWAVLLLGERPGAGALPTVLVVLACVAVTQKAR
ncbi:DMT family transporter [Nocardiopsis changdeensis]|uniref:DMT family transporter n=1 Tax=Nocardiopsis changdeensis TaxID=2831969 RepID=A0ABX8BR02_9ACTN|nr:MULTISPECIES: DMT family transporter [Nocardiopsis]QUX24649.1 DMT family transporter [Nocardiopsis changdeensis]QYX35037.1 DMT family transporter [Nocardiopsis sp. MT53]